MDLIMEQNGGIRESIEVGGETLFFFLTCVCNSITSLRDHENLLS